MISHLFSIIWKFYNYWTEIQCKCFLFQAAILQQTSDYIQQLESDKTRLLAINNQLSTQLKRLLGSDYEKQVSVNYNPSPPTKRKKRDTGVLFVWIF